MLNQVVIHRCKRKSSLRLLLLATAAQVFFPAITLNAEVLVETQGLGKATIPMGASDQGPTTRLMEATGEEMLEEPIEQGAVLIPMGAEDLDQVRESMEIMDRDVKRTPMGDSDSEPGEGQMQPTGQGQAVDVDSPEPETIRGIAQPSNVPGDRPVNVRMRIEAQELESMIATLAKEAAVIVKGSAKTKRSEWNEDRNFIWTFVTFSVSETIKGDTIAGKEIEIKIPGGIVDDIGQASSDEVTFDEGEQAIVFLRKGRYRGKSYFDVVGLDKGKFSIVRDMVDGMQLDAFQNKIKEAVKSSN